MPVIRNELTTDFSRGMDDSSAPTSFPRNAASLILNGRIKPDGTVERRSGSRRRHPSTLGAFPGYGGFWFKPPGMDEQIISIVGDTAFSSTDRGENWSQIATGLREDYYSFATMRIGATLYLFAANGDTTIKRWDGTTWDTLPNAPSGVKFIETFNDRLYAAGHNGPIVQASKIRDPATWATPNGLLLQVTTHGADGELSGMFQLGPSLLVYDKESTSYIDGYGEQTLIVATGPTGFSRSVGCLAHRSIVGVGDSGVCWLSNRGVEYYQNGRGITLLTSGIQGFMDTVSRPWLDQNPGEPCAVYDQIRQDYYLTLSTDAVLNNRTVVVNVRGGGAPSVDTLPEVSGNLLFGEDANGFLTVVPGGQGVVSDSLGHMTLSYSGVPLQEDANGHLGTATNDTASSSLFIGPCLQAQSVVYSIGYDGFVRKHLVYEKDDELSDGTGGNDVTMTIVSRPFLMGTAENRKRIRAVRVSAITDAPAAIDVALRSRGQTTGERSITITGTSYNQARRSEVLMHSIGDAPQAQIRTTDRVRISVIGVSGEIMREEI